jgi:hypothetical protein
VFYRGWEEAKIYVNDTVNYTEAIFVVVIMVLASTRPIMTLAEAGLERVAAVGRRTPAAWWIIAPLLSRLSEVPLFLGSILLTSLNDNALITYLGTLVPHLDDRLKIALVEGAVTGGGLTVIANAPNPAGQALLARHFDGAVQPLRLLLGALAPTVITAAAFRLI